MDFSWITDRATSRRRKLVALSALLAAFAGCKVGPNYLPQRIQTKPSWSLTPSPRLAGEMVDTSAWWSYFQDPVLNHLVAVMGSGNLTLKEAGQRIIEARARRGIAAGNLFPQSQTLDGSYSKARVSSNTANFFTFPGVFDTDRSPENWSIGLSTAWELDFWGRYRRAVESADAALDATIAARDDVAVILVAETAAAYVEIRTLDRRIGLAMKNIDIQRRTLELVKEKQAAGLASALDVAQAETNLGQTSAIPPQLEILRRQANHRLCVLLGRSPEDLAPELGITGTIPKPPEQLCFGVPADLLRRRPDVRRAERELAAQSALIGVAQSDFYPHISLVGTIGYQAENFSQLGSSGSSAGIISPNFSWKILNYGRIKNNVAAEKAAFHRLAYAYRSSVLNAEREAEDAQVAYVYNFDRAESLQYGANGAQTAVDRAMESYRVGSSDFNRLFLLQSELLRQQDSLAQTEGDIALSMIAMFKAVGGGWENVRANCSPIAVVMEEQFTPIDPGPIESSAIESPSGNLQMNAPEIIPNGPVETELIEARPI
jgi:NodT family efflux transporter outer membrane factor (OMF) lipoprotein